MPQKTVSRNLKKKNVKKVQNNKAVKSVKTSKSTGKPEDKSLRPEVEKNKSKESQSNTSEQETFALELKWCMNNLEASIQSTTNENERAKLIKNHRSLSNPNKQFIKKRLLMNALFGNYRKKMSEQEKDLKQNKPSFCASKQSSSSIYIKKSTQGQSNDFSKTCSEFKFDF